MSNIDKIILISGNRIFGIISVYFVLNIITVLGYLFFCKISKKYDRKTNKTNEKHCTENHVNENTEEIINEIENIIKKNENKSLYYAYIFIILFFLFIASLILKYLYKIPDKIIFTIIGNIIIFSMYTVIHFYENFRKIFFKDSE